MEEIKLPQQQKESQSLESIARGLAEDGLIVEWFDADTVRGTAVPNVTRTASAGEALQC